MRRDGQDAPALDKCQWKLIAPACGCWGPCRGPPILSVPPRDHFSKKMIGSQLPREVEPGRPGQGTQDPPNRQADRPDPHAPSAPQGQTGKEAGGGGAQGARPPPPGPPAGRPGRCLPEAVCAPADRADPPY